MQIFSVDEISQAGISACVIPMKIRSLGKWKRYLRASILPIRNQASYN